MFDMETSKAARITGWITTVFIGLFMLVDGGGHTMRLGLYVKGTVQLGYPESSVMPIGIVTLIATILYLIPRTSIIGAILLTAYFGGAVATMVHARQPVYFPVVFGILTWLGLWLRDMRLRALTPLAEQRS
jgi:DoxX-like family